MKKFRKRWCVGDIHGNYKGLKQAFERANVDYEKDQFISLGDIADGYSEMHLVMDLLSQIHPDNLVMIIGNHDEWFKEWLNMGVHPTKWEQGGEGSFKSYLKLIGKPDMWERKFSGYLTALNPADVPLLHQEMLRNQYSYYIDDKNNLFVHGGFNRHFDIKEQIPYIYYWDRDLWMSALSYERMSKGHDKLHGKNNNKFKMKNEFNRIFIGHTATTNWEIKGEVVTTPMKAANIWNIDTGGGFEGKITIMNIDNPEEYYQSDLATELYPEDKGRR